MSVASFKVKGKFDSAGADKEGTVTIDRDTGVVLVRPKGSRTTYETTLGRLATWVCQKGFANRPTDEES
jgi:hypothetical protein